VKFPLHARTRKAPVTPRKRKVTPLPWPAGTLKSEGANHPIRAATGSMARTTAVTPKNAVLKVRFAAW